MRAARGLPLLLGLCLAACAAPAGSASGRPATEPSATAPSPAAASRTPADELAWLAGHWVMATSGGQVEELWLPPAGGTLYGVGRTVSGDTTRFFEFLAIEPRDGTGGATLAYVARPAGRAPTEFLLVELAEGRAVFANPQHDFPKRIRYERRGDELHARVDDGTDDGQGEDFVYRRAE